jgi:hypothetical protein
MCALLAGVANSLRRGRLRVSRDTVGSLQSDDASCEQLSQLAGVESQQIGVDLGVVLAESRAQMVDPWG